MHAWHACNALTEQLYVGSDAVQAASRCPDGQPIFQATNRITVFNNGDGVPVEVHKEEGVYVPELIFGHLLTSSNYNDDEKKVRACTATTAIR